MGHSVDMELASWRDSHLRKQQRGDLEPIDDLVMRNTVPNLGSASCAFAIYARNLLVVTQDVSKKANLRKAGICRVSTIRVLLEPSVHYALMRLSQLCAPTLDVWEQNPHLSLPGPNTEGCHCCRRRQRRYVRERYTVN